MNSDQPRWRTMEATYPISTAIQKRPRSSYQRFGLRAAWLRWRQCTSTNPWLFDIIFLGRGGQGQLHNRGPNRIWLWPSWSIVACSCILTEIPSGNWWTETNSEPEIRLIHHYDPKNFPGTSLKIRPSEAGHLSALRFCFCISCSSGFCSNNTRYVDNIPKKGCVSF